MNMFANNEMKRLLRIRSHLNKTRPKFVRFKSWEYKRLQTGWRYPNGLDNKVHRRFQGYLKLPDTGYRGPKKVRGLHPGQGGHYNILVHNVKDLEKIEDKRIQFAVIGRAVGFRKRMEILRACLSMNIRVSNFNYRAISLMFRKEKAEQTDRARRKEERMKETIIDELEDVETATSEVDGSSDSASENGDENAEGDN